MVEQERIHVVYAANDAFVRHLAVSLCSLLEHSKDRNPISLYVLSMGISKENRKLLFHMTNDFDCSFEIFELGDLKERFGGAVEAGGYDISIFGRFFVGEVLPETVERVLYLDCDTVILKPLHSLWKTDLKGRILGAVMEPTIYEAVKAQIGLKSEEPYFNSGVLLIDLKAWRKEHVLQGLLDFYCQAGGNLLAGDQDTLNGTLKGKIKPVSPKYNFFTNYRYYHYGDLVGMSESYKWIPKDEFQKAKKHPVILHYMGDERPWKAGNLNHYRRAYEIYLKKTPWAGTIKDEGQRIYMLVYHMMNYLTFLCPPVRRYISKRFGMQVIQSRKVPVGRKN